MTRKKLNNTISAMFINPEHSTDYLFYAHILGKCEIVIDNNMKFVAGVSFSKTHYVLYVNTEMFDVHPLKIRLGIIKHEMLHILNGHMSRGKGLDANRWNYATDCAINQLITGTHLIPDAILPSKNFNKSAEFYYDENLGNHDNHTIWDKSCGDDEFQKFETSKMIEEATEKTIKQIGKIPKECNTWLEIHRKSSKFNWSKILRGIVGNTRVSKRTTINRRSRRFPNVEYIKGHVKNRTFNLLVIADVSGSMSDDAVVETFSEIQKICDVTKTMVNVIQVDTIAHNPSKLSDSFKRVSRGGTNLSVALEKAKECKLDYQAILILTDGYLTDSDIKAFNDTKKRIIWLIEKSGKVNKLMKNCYKL